MRRRCAASFGENFFSELARVDPASESRTFRNAKVELILMERSDLIPVPDWHSIQESNTRFKEIDFPVQIQEATSCS